MSAVLRHSGPSSCGRGLIRLRLQASNVGDSSSSCLLSRHDGRCSGQRRLLSALSHSSCLQKSPSRHSNHSTLQQQPFARQRQQPLQRQPLLKINNPVIPGIYRRSFSKTAAFLASDTPSTTMEWSADRVRKTFIEYFQKHEHTFGEFVAGFFCFIASLLHCFHCSHRGGEMSNFILIEPQCRLRRSCLTRTLPFSSPMRE
jgi:hypothetical protein